METVVYWLEVSHLIFVRSPIFTLSPSAGWMTFWSASVYLRVASHSSGTMKNRDGHMSGWEFEGENSYTERRSKFKISKLDEFDYTQKYSKWQTSKKHSKGLKMLWS